MARARQSRMSDEEALNGFIAEGIALFDHSLWASGYRPKFSVKMSVSEPISYGDHEPTPELLESFLLRLRPLMAKGEPYFVGRMKNLVKRYATDQPVIEQIEEQETQWKRVIAGGGIKVVNFGEDLLPEDAWNMYINGQYFHRNEAERARFMSLADPMQAMVRYQFLQHVFGGTIYVSNTAAIAAYARDEGKLDFNKIN